MKEGYIYVPVIKWKANEYGALKSLRDSVKDHIFPLIQIAPPGYDGDTKTVSHTIEKRLDKFIKTYTQIWGGRSAFIDFNLLSVHDKLSNGQQPVAYIFDKLKLGSCSAIPVFALGRNELYLNAIKDIIKNQKRGACLRITLEEAYNAALTSDILKILGELDLTTTEVDIVVDLAAPKSFEPINMFASAVKQFIGKITSIGKWRNVIICAGSFPESMGDIKSPGETIPRQEWKLYKELRRLDLKGLEKELIFGDYNIIFPNQPELKEPWKYTQSAAVRYTIDDAWIVLKGRGLKKTKRMKEGQEEKPSAYGVGYAQYVSICRLLIKNAHFKGASYAVGDKKIYDTAKLTAAETKNWTTNMGSPQTMREAGMNHHFTKVVDDLSSLVGT